MNTARDLANNTRLAISDMKKILVNDLEERCLSASKSCKWSYNVDIQKFAKDTGLSFAMIEEVIHDFCSKRDLKIAHDKNINTITISWFHYS